MKVKAKLDVAKIKQWLFEHGEKVALGMMGVVFLFFVYKALTRETLDASKEPDKLVSMANDVTSHVSNSKWDAKREKAEVVDYQQRAERKPIEAKSYVLIQPLDPPLADKKSNRGMPEFFKLEELRTAAGVGAFALLPEGSAAPAAGNVVAAPAEGAAPAANMGGGGLRNRGAAPAGGGAARPAAAAPRVAEDKGHRGIRPSSGARLKAQPWAVVTGLIPIDKQIKEYARVFQNSQGGDLARDVPRYMVRLERVEVTDKNPNSTDWQKVKLARTFEREWESQASEVIPAANVDPGATGHLGPLVNGVWGEAIAHPKIQLASAAAKEHEAATLAVQAAKVEEQKVADKPAADDDFTFTQPAAAPRPDNNPAAANAVASGPAPPQYRLLRAFDYTVEPNKKYRYRVVLAIANPNFGVAPRFLLNAEDGQKQMFELVSEPTDVVTVPGGYGVLAGSVTPSPRTDPSAKVVFIKIDENTGIEAPYEATVQRGSYGNFSGVDVVARDPRSNNTTDLSNIDFRTGMVVLDMAGGKSLAMKKREQPFTSPGEVLLVEPSGKLVVHRELDDQPLYHDFKPPETPKESPKKEKSSSSSSKGAGKSESSGGNSMRENAKKLLKASGK